jgi:DNA repair protein SbcC/Rad50
MFRKIVIKNFQSHKKSILNLDPGVNVIIGSSDTGKTAILRALRWLVWNRPQGEAFRSNWGGDTSVKIYTEENVIKRVRGFQNQYYVNKLELNAVKAEVPAEVSTILNMEEVNLQTQFARPFLLDSSSGEVAQYFNQTVHLDKIDSSVRSIQHWVRQLNQDIESNKSRLEDLEINLSDFDGLDALEEKVQVIEHLDKTRNSLESKKYNINLRRGEIQTLDKEEKNLQSILSLKEEVGKTLKLITKRSDLLEQRQALLNVYTNYTTLYKEEKKLQSILSLKDMVSTTLRLVSKKSSLLEQRQALSNAYTKYKTLCIEIKKSDKDKLLAEEEFHEKFPSICPLCGQYNQLR